MTSRAIQQSVTQVAAAVVVGATIEALLPAPVEKPPVHTQVFELMVQVGLNGVALALVAGSIRGGGEDLTFGIPFANALYGSQPSMRKRIETLAELTKTQVVQISRQMTQ